jgi:hypothetical protein
MLLQAALNGDRDHPATPRMPQELAVEARRRCSNTELVGHLPIFAAMLMLLVFGSDPARRAGVSRLWPWPAPQRLARRRSSARVAPAPRRRSPRASAISPSYRVGE